MKKVIESIGWPSISKVGAKASFCGWLLVQHSAHDLSFQKQCLSLMNQLPEGDIDKANIAYLTDRILVKDAKPQIYGTQFYEENGSLQPRQILDIANLDLRRQEMGLEPFVEYRQTIIDNNSKS